MKRFIVLILGFLGTIYVNAQQVVYELVRNANDEIEVYAVPNFSNFMFVSTGNQVTLTLPVGSGGSASLIAQGVAGNWSITSVGSNGADDFIAIGQVSVGQLTTATGTGFLLFTLSSDCGGTAVGDIFLHDNGAPVPTGGLNWDNAYNVVINSIPFFGDTYAGNTGIGINCSALPVELAWFNVEREDDGAMLTWATASEENNKGFEIQRSQDADKWMTIGWADGMGTSFQSQNYAHLDARPFNGTNYYRLRQLDYDGKFSYSPIRVLEFELNTNTASVFPNPTSDILKVHLPPQVSGRVTFRVMDADRRIVKEKTIDYSDTIYEEVDVRSLPEGMYFIQVVSRQYVETFPFFMISTN